ncbi:hypothetical protein [Eubacterium oxidoreducens]|uniref:Leader peptidase (Prepilin peptidase) / N-methyltransferase n=1 Tax=Eubacterium oxidoreducens TaxID=1732 RepID=A0A1G5ZZV4_EUBOX|nr:hypothetical protein [Eubacterium oxidoreducens]SDB01739.1 hypothetical protein SAMN02910417_00059 [Eubacterium oxidoreducens]
MWEMLLNENTKIIVWIILLVIASIQDLRWHSIHVAIPLVAGCAGVLLQIVCAKEAGFTIVSGIIVGMVFVGISLRTGGKIGLGDALMIMAAACYFSGERFLWLLMAAGGLSLVGFWILHLTKHKQREIPFLPFLLGGSVVAICI